MKANGKLIEYTSYNLHTHESFNEESSFSSFRNIAFIFKENVNKT